MKAHYLLCTDGLTDALKDDEIIHIFRLRVGTSEYLCAE